MTQDREGFPMTGARIKRCFAAGCALVSLAIFLVCGVAFLAPERVTDANYERIQPGMTLHDVSAILGSSDRQTEVPQGGGDATIVWIQPPGSLWNWRIHRLEITIEFKDGKVIEKRKFDYWL
jgi:hypothetical protein